MPKYAVRTDRMTVDEYRKLPKKRSKRRDFNPESYLAGQLANVQIVCERQYKFHPKRRWRMDFAIPNSPNLPLLVEAQGGTFAKAKLGHSTGKGLQESFEKINEAVILGFRVLQFDSQQVRDGIALTTILRALGYGAHKQNKDGKGR